MQTMESILKEVSSIVEEGKKAEARKSEAVTALRNALTQLEAETNGHEVGKKPLARVYRCTVSGCGRTFGHPLHLGRHRSATHGKVATPKVKAKRKNKAA